MSTDFTRGARLLKALSDETRIRIVHILSCGEQCACDLQNYFKLTQPTLSHHLTILVETGLIMTRPEGKWVYYRIAPEAFIFLEEFMHGISHESDTCECKKIGRKCT